MYGVYLTRILLNSYFKNIKSRKQENKLFETIEHGNTPYILYSYIILKSTISVIPNTYTLMYIAIGPLNTLAHYSNSTVPLRIVVVHFCIAIKIRIQITTNIQADSFNSEHLSFGKVYIIYTKCTIQST